MNALWKPWLAYELFINWNMGWICQITLFSTNHSTISYIKWYQLVSKSPYLQNVIFVFCGMRGAFKIKFLETFHNIACQSFAQKTSNYPEPILMPSYILITKGYNVTAWHLSYQSQVWKESMGGNYLPHNTLGIVLPITVPLKGVIIFELSGRERITKTRQ